jgi:hypothetical protein
MKATIDLQDFAHELQTTPLEKMAVYDPVADEQVNLLEYVRTHPNADLESAETGDGLWMDYDAMGKLRNQD